MDTCTGFYLTYESAFTCSYCNGTRQDHYNGKIKIVEKKGAEEDSALRLPSLVQPPAETKPN